MEDMNTFSESLISFETAKLAKECGCELKGDYLYIGDRDIDLILNIGTISKIYWHALTQSLLQKWLRKIHKIHIIVNPTVTDNWTFALCNIGNENIELNGEVIYDSTDYNSYEEALEKGLQEALKLI